MKQHIKLENNTIIGIIIGGIPDTGDTGWIEVDYPTELQVGMIKTGSNFSSAVNEWNAIRQQRNALLQATDWTQLPDVLSEGRLSQAQVDAYVSYRQALANIPQNFTDPSAVVWPVKPE